ncbi:recombinase family protein [Candidatus Saccharibacteria bacterium CPR2]|nr:recombinase family protein [Candidatus Saccharibacteria bacterium CPR2]
MKYFVYIRKSTEDEEKQVLSLETQMDKAKEMFGHLDLIFLEPESASAFKPYNRPIFADMIKRIENGEAQGIIAWHPDRVSRNEIDAAQVTYMIRTGKIQDLKFGSYNFDNSPEGIMMLQMVMSQSQYFSAKLSKDVKRGLEKKIKMGWKPGVVKAGYLNNPGMEKGSRIVSEDPVRYRQVRKMWDLLLTGAYTVPQIQDIANNEWGFRSVKRKKIGGGPIARSTLYALFTDPFYAGQLFHKGEYYKGSHKAMITLDEFDRAQMILGRKGKPRPQKHRFAFTGFIRCGDCGCSITAEPKLKVLKSTGETKKYVYYHCTWKRPCNQRKVITEAELEKQIEAELSKITIIPEFKDWALDVLNSSSDEEIENRTILHKQQTSTMLAIQKQLDNLIQMYTRELIDDQEYTKQRSELQGQKVKIQEKLRKTEDRADEWLELAEKVFDFAVHARHNFVHGDLNAKKEIFVALGNNPILMDGQLTIELNEWFKPIAENSEKLATDFELVRTDKKDPQNGGQFLQSNQDLFSWLRKMMASDS